MTLWTPVNFGSALRTLLMADALGGLADTDPVTTWTDASGNGRHAVQNTAAEKPLYRVNAQNGLPVVRFDGLDDDMTISSFGLPKPCSIFFVVKTPADTTADQRVYHGNGNTVICRLHVTANQAWMHAGANFTYDTSIATGVWQLHANIYDGAISRGSVNGGTPVSGNAGSNGTTSTLVLGSTGGSNFADMDLGEWFAVDRAVSLTDEARAIGYLAHKWGLTTNLPANHPYKSGPPTIGGSGLRYTLGSGLRNRVVRN